MLQAQLQTLSAYTLLKSTLRLPAYVKQAQKLGYTHVALTDENQLSGILEFCRLAQAASLVPIVGLTLNYRYENETHQLLAYAPNAKAYEELLAASTATMTAGPQELSTLLPKLAHLKILLPSDNPARYFFISNQKAAATDFLQLFQSFKGNFSCGIEPVEQADEILTLRQSHWLHFLQEQQIPALPLHQVRYLQAKDAFATEVLGALEAGEILELQQTPKTGTKYLWSPQEMQAGFSAEQWPLLQKNCQEFVANLQFTPPLKQTLLPHYPFIENYPDAKSYLRHLAQTNLPKRIAKVTPAYEERLNYELGIIETMGFADYFLIVWDVMNYCHTHGVMTGAGRGSSASSLVAYVLHITDVDPLRYDLLFERFLNPERKSMPDIDLDIPDNKREEVLQYVAEKYGKKQVAQIATFGTLAAKMVLRDVSRVFGLSQSEANQFSKAIPNVLKISLKESYQQSPTLQRLVQQSEKNQLLFKTALKLEGLPRHVSTHAAGVVIGDGPLVQWVPLQNGSNGLFLTQFTMGDVEAIGLLKMDFLGLKNLAILQEAVDVTGKLLGRPFDVHEIPLDDGETLALFARGDTAGIFQFESQGIRNVLRKLGPTSFEDVAAVNALYRPGPMENIDSFIRRKKGQEKISYPDPALEPILANTYGIIIYQEQIMQVANRLAGFSLGQADILRRAVSKKKKELLDQQRASFVAGSVAHHHSVGVANQVYDLIEKFANYGFPRSHAFAYSVVGFELAYLKVHYPAAFFTALLNSVSNHDSKLKSYLGEAKKAQVAILGPDINQSGYSFTLTKDGLRFGLGKIKGLRRDFLQEIFQERRNGAYRSFDDFLFRMSGKWLKEDWLIPLILAGAFDSLGVKRRELTSQLDGKIKNILYAAGSMDLLNVMELKEEGIQEYSLEERLNFEEEYLGTFVSGHPLETTRPLAQHIPTTYIGDYQVGQNIATFIYVKEIKKIRTKKGEQMAFVQAQDLTGEVSVTLFPILYRQVALHLAPHELYLLRGKVETSRFQEELQVLANSFQTLDEVEKELAMKAPGKLFLRITQDATVLQQLHQLLQKFPGNSTVILYYQDEKRTRPLPANFNVTPQPELLSQLENILGVDNVVWQKPSGDSH